MRRMDSHHFREALRAGRPLVLDGGLATQLEAQGADLSDRLWSARLLVEAPDQIVAAHLAFYRAGAQVATTASYQATFEGFAARGLDHDAAADLLCRSVELADRARVMALDEGIAGPLFVAASIGPYGAMLADGSEYRGGYGRTVAELADFHRERFRVLAGTGADVLAVETIPEVEEARAVTALLGELPGTAAWISFSCADGGHLRGGTPIEEAVLAIKDAPGVVATGVNCTAPEHVDELITRIRSVSSLPIAVYPNSGEGWDAAARRWAGATAGRVDGEAAARWRSAGAQLIGGCCRVSPSQVGAIGRALAIVADG
jgi:homocysteine S-methyltransferase